MAKYQHIKPFPETIDRDYFGAWLSGFVDGEGCFVLFVSKLKKDTYRTSKMSAAFKIALRQDDQDVLEKIQSFFRCGTIHVERPGARALSKMPNANPRSVFVVARTSHLKNIIIPNFKKYPLIAKKSRDFSIWNQGVDLLYQNKGISQSRIASRFDALFWILRNQRKFDAQLLPIPKVSSPPKPKFIQPNFLDRNGLDHG